MRPSSPQPAHVPVFDDSTDDENRNIKDGRKRKRRKKEKKVKEKQPKEERDSRFPWHKYPKAEGYLYSRLEEFATLDGQPRLDLKESVWSHIVHTYGPFKGYVDQDVNAVRLSLP